MKLLRLIIFLIVTLIFLCSSTIIGQQEQVAFTPVVYEIDQQLRQELGILNKYKEDYQKSRLLRDENNQYFVEITYLRRGTTLTEKYLLSQSELENIRQSIDGNTNNLPSSTTNNKIEYGRYGLIASATLHSIHQGIFISYLMSNETRQYIPWVGSKTVVERTKFGRIFPYLFSTATFATTLALTNNKQINSGAVNTHLWSSAYGVVHGGGILFMLDETEWDNLKIFSFMAATSLTEGWLMYYLAKRNNIDYVRSIAWNTGNLWGTIGGALTRFILLDSITDKDIGRPTIGVSLIAGGTVGVFLMNYLQQNYPRSAGDYIAINSLGIASSVFGSGLITDSKSVSTGSVYGLLFTTAGLTLGYLSTAKTSLLTSEGAIVGIGTAVGGLLGSGILLIENSKTAFFKTAWVGGLSMAGWLGTYLYLTQTGHRAAKRKADKKMNFNFGINPSGLVLMKSAPEKQYNMLRNSINMDLVSFRMQF